MQVLDSFEASAVEPDDYISVMDDSVIVDSKVDMGDVVIIKGYSTIEGDTVEHPVPADTVVYLIAE